MVPICPEQLAGFPTPRLPVALLKGRAIDASGKDVTSRLRQGAREVLKIALLTGCRHAFLKARSPSCGETGYTTRLLRRHGIKVRVLD
jgi:uncharacterized protein YbbK (DUF523 family)